MKALFHPLTLLLGALLICTSAFAQITRVQSSNDANLLTIKNNPRKKQSKKTIQGHPKFAGKANRQVLGRNSEDNGR